MNWYYFKHKGMTLAPIYAKNEKEAREKLPIQHSWCNAPINAELLKTEQLSQYEIICQL